MTGIVIITVVDVIRESISKERWKGEEGWRRSRLFCFVFSRPVGDETTSTLPYRRLVIMVYSGNIGPRKEKEPQLLMKESHTSIVS